MKKIIFIFAIFAVLGCNTTTYRGAPVDSNVIKDACYLTIGRDVVIAAHAVAAVERWSSKRSIIILSNGRRLRVKARPGQVMKALEDCKKKLNEPDKGKKPGSN